MADVRCEQLSLALQFVASFCWAIGAGLAGPLSAADFLQFFAAVAWCLANVASAASLRARLRGGAGHDGGLLKGDKAEPGLELKGV